MDQALFKAYETAALETLSLVRRPLHPLVSHRSTEPHTVIFTLGNDRLEIEVDGV